MQADDLKLLRITVVAAMLGSMLGLAGCGEDLADSQPRGAIGTDPKVHIAYDHHILVDQFGYRPGDPKFAVIRNPHVGFDSHDTFLPGRHYQLRRVEDGAVVFAGTPAAWNDGAVESSSGDNGWWFEFSSVTAPGRYYVVDDDKKLRSPIFAIDQQVYKKVLKTAMRMFFYQRSGFAKKPPFAEPCWADEAAYLGPRQDSQAHDIADPDNSAKVRDLSGGWFDAGDTNKYVTFAVQPVHQLLNAYREHPAAFTDDFNIPESGNGIPDLIDEVKWEIDWLKKMQEPNGGVALKVGETIYTSASPPSSDATPRFYIPPCSSATIAAAGMFAHAAYAYAQFPQLAAEAADLKTRALSAWSNYAGIAEKQTGCDSGIVHAGNADLSAADQAELAAEAAIYLYAVTGDKTFDAYVRAHYREMRPYHDTGWSRYKPDQGEALLFYTTLADVDKDFKQTLLADKRADVEAQNHWNPEAATQGQLYGFNPRDDLYRAYLHDPQYHWGSNNPRANYGNTNLDVVAYGIEGPDAESYQLRALEGLHYFHGVNPLGMVYLSNMYADGATLSANRIYHTWFQPYGSRLRAQLSWLPPYRKWLAGKERWNDALTSACGPAPGYVPGGPNANAVANGVPAFLEPPAGQPPQKAYRDWNNGGADSAWAVTEPAIYYQSAYIELLSAFAQ